MSHPPDWLPYHCPHCMAYRGHNEDDFAECPDECRHNFEHQNEGGGEYQCSTCGQTWKILPPDDWNGKVLTRKEEPFREPPKNRYGRDHIGYRRSEWGAYWPDNPDHPYP